MTALYKTGIFLYSLFIRFAALFNEKAALFIKGRKDWKKKLKNQINTNDRYIWFHCASLGEFEQGRPVIEEIKEQYPEFKIILTFFSPSGYEVRKTYSQADIVTYLPFDTRTNAQSFLDLVNPEMAFFVKYEFWYFYMAELKKKNIPLFIFSAIFRENQYFFKSSFVGKWFRKTLFNVSHFFVQNENSAALLKKIGLTNVSISGDTRFDRVAAIAAAAKEIDVVEKFRKNRLLIIAGSTWKPDEELLTAFINQSSNLKFIIAPHEVSASNVNRIHQLLKKPAISFRKLNENEAENHDVLIIDSIGLLSSLYQYGTIAYIGGGFGVGIHNILEAATFGMPIVHGPNFKKFKEAVDLNNDGSAFSISNYDELKSKFDQLTSDKTYLNDVSQISKKYVQKNIGSTKFIINKVFNIANKN